MSSSLGSEVKLGHANMTTVCWWNHFLPPHPGTSTSGAVTTNYRVSARSSNCAVRSHTHQNNIFICLFWSSGFAYVIASRLNASERYLLLMLTHPAQVYKRVWISPSRSKNEKPPNFWHSQTVCFTWIMIASGGQLSCQNFCVVLHQHTNWCLATRKML